MNTKVNTTGSATPARLLTVVVLLTAVVLGWLSWSGLRSHRTAVAAMQTGLRITELRGIIIHLDEVLTMSARMAAVTGDLKWEQRYRSFESGLDAAIKGAIRLAPGAGGGEAAAQTDMANIKLVEMENHSFDLVRQGRLKEAQTVLFSNEYETQKKVYADGMTEFASLLDGAVEKIRVSQQQKTYLTIGVTVAGIPLLILGWWIVLRIVRNWQTTLTDASRKSEHQANELNEVNQTLDARVVARTAQYKNSQQALLNMMEDAEAIRKQVEQTNEELLREIAERRQAESALRDSEARYRTLFDTAAEAVWLMTYTFLDCNEKACELLACNREDIIGHTPAELSPPTQPDGKDSAQAAKERIDAALEGHPQLFYWQHKRKDGTLVDTEISLTDVTIGGQRILLAMGRDITERKRAQAQMEELHKQLLDVSRDAGMAEVATNVLHNVGNVLNSVNVSTSLVSEKIRESRVSSLAKVVALMRAHQNDLAAFLTQDPKGMQLCDYLDNLAQYLSKEQAGVLKELESLNANVEHIKEIVTMQQSYARAAGIVETLSIADLVEDALRMNNGALARHEVQVAREYIATPSVPVDKHKVLQILVNLVRNAKYALDEGGQKDKLLTIRVATERDGFVTISVIDNGVGIPRENLTRIFEHGFTTRKDGHGFGLHSGALAAKEMGGSLSAHSDGPSQGATFTLSLPLLQEHENA